MKATPVLVVDADAPDPEILSEAAAILCRGGLVAFPTETVYGLGANALDASAVARIFAAKGRPATNPVIVHVADADDVSRLVTDFPARARRLAEAFWPGPLTLVLPRRAEVPDVVTAGGPTVAVRVPAHPVAQGLLRASGLPIAAPSANRSTCLSPTRAAHVMRGLDGRIDLLLDAGPTRAGLESTVLDVMQDPPVLLRPGPIDRRRLEAIIGPVARRAESTSPIARSPGMMERHYAPRTPLEYVADDGRERVESLRGAGHRVGWLTFGPTTIRSSAGLTIFEMPSEPVAYAARLYDALHAFDDAGLDHIVAALPPEEDCWLAIHDRLKRAGSRHDLD